jgi:hypothetical protein
MQRIGGGGEEPVTKKKLQAILFFSIKSKKNGP